VPAEITCYRCGSSLAALSLPWSRQDVCPECSVYLHVCMMCSYFDRNVPEQCREDDAEHVSDKETTNFCEWFQASENAFDAPRSAADERSRAELDALFGGDGPGSSSEVNTQQDAAEDLFK